jgi:L-seryl-tRNA(Ser) seleniumtransferase
MNLNRRAFVKWVGALPLLGSVNARQLWAKTWGARNNIYARIGVRPFINARGTWTYLSGSLELAEVRAAKQRAALYFVDMYELQRRG